MHPSGAYRALVLLELLLAVPTFVALRFINAPYGRYRRRGFGPTVPARLGWVAMEAPAALLFAVVYATGSNRTQPVPLLLLGLWELHYVHRAFVYPFTMRAGARMPVTIPALALGFNVLNGYINARWVGEFGSYPNGWLTDPRMLAGGALFLCGMALNVTADRTLRRLRPSGQTGYRVPHGGAFELVSCPNYLGEMVEWSGWALATWSLPGLAFAAYTTANLAPRALAHHAWYREMFPDYPAGRRALIPYVL